jgi:hypothetical protein
VIWQFVFLGRGDSHHSWKTFHKRVARSPTKTSKRREACAFNDRRTVVARVSSKQSIFFRFKPKQTETQSVSVVFRFVSRNQKKYFSVCFVVSDWYRNNRNKQNLWYGELKAFIFNKFAVVLVGLLFVSFFSKHAKLPVSILKRNNRNKRLVSDSAETSFGSSFSCFYIKLVSENTLVVATTLFQQETKLFSAKKGRTLQLMESHHAECRNIVL